MKHLVYKTTNLVNGKYYIGVHSCSCNPCRYLGSGKALKAAISKHGLGNFQRETLEEFSNREEAFEYEASVVTVSPLTYNLDFGGKGRSHLHRPSKASRLKMSASSTGKTHTKETRLKMSQSKLKNHPSAHSVTILGVVYPSKRQAAKALKCCRSRL